MDNNTLIAVGVDTDGRLWTDHFGMSPRFDLYDHAGTLVEKRPNRYALPGAHHHGNPMLIIDILPECTVWIARALGPKQKIVEERGIRVVKTDATDSVEAIDSFLARSE